MLKIYNSLSKEKTDFKPINSNQVSMYLCGITVYDFCHIGHARTAVAFDVIYRYLQFSNYNVKYVRNITDIDDKIIERAKAAGTSFKDLTESFIHAMHEDYKALNISDPTIEPKATETIDEMQTMIAELIAKNAAYISESGHVYFKVDQYQAYGELANQSLEKLQAGARVEVNNEKQSPLDFVLWKPAKAGEPSWSSPWGEGRPGWHIECSAMATKFLGETIDIHGGGNDLKFPHHENERAQSECCSGQTFANYWMHVGFVNVNDEKMSKSLDNFFTIRDVLKTFDAETIRFFLISSHYRSPINYSLENLEQARASLATLYTALRGIELLVNEIEHPAKQEFIAAMDDDINTPVAISVLFDLACEINKSKNSSPNKAKQLATLLRQLGGVLGILQLNADMFLQNTPQNKEICRNKVEDLITARKLAREQKDWAKADEIRAQLDELNVILEDSIHGTTWRIK